MTVLVSDEAGARARPGGAPTARASALKARAEGMLRFLGLEAELGLLFVTDERMSQLNRVHMGKRGPTDVLSFPLLTCDEALAIGYGLEAELAGLPFPARAVHTPRGAPVLLGDVVLAPGVVGRQAADAKRTRLAEATMLLAHGLLHLLGYDHRDPWEEALMRARTLWLERVAAGDPPRSRLGPRVAVGKRLQGSGTAGKRP